MLSITLFTISSLAIPSIYITAISVLLLLPQRSLMTLSPVSLILLLIRTILKLIASPKASFGPCTTTSFSTFGTPLVGHPLVEAISALSSLSAKMAVSPSSIDVKMLSKSFSSFISPMLMASFLSLSSIFTSALTRVRVIRFVMIRSSVTVLFIILST